MRIQWYPGQVICMKCNVEQEFTDRHEWLEAMDEECAVCGCKYHRGMKPEKYGVCECGEHVMLNSFTCTCDCGRDYNSSGQQLAPRNQWGEETGESLSDILNIR